MEREVELELWREAGKQIGRKLGVVQERKRLKKEMMLLKWVLLFNQLMILVLLLLIMKGAFE
jgi:hypothetical protein